MSLSVGWQLACVAGVIIPVMAALWAVQVRKRDAGVVDVGWSAGLGLAAVFCALTGEGDPTRRLIVGALGGVWGLRLAWHILTDRVLSGREDGRYADLRDTMGPRLNRFLFVFFQFQALLVVILAAPFALACADARPGPAATDIAAAALWLVAKTGETIADRQLKAFKRDPASKGRTCRAGLWRYSRHPNYFFEWLIWCAYALLALQAPWGWLGLSAPILMLFLILKVTGIPPTEKQSLRSRGEDYREYQRTTSAFVPWFPRKADA